MTQSKSAKNPRANVKIKKDNVNSLNENSTRILLRESEMLQTLFIQAENGIQSTFNFYLTLVTAVAGGIAIVLQVMAGNSTQTWWAMISTASLLIFIAIIGSAYLSSISARYGHMICYARGIDEIRRFLINQFNISTPPIYRKFLDKPITKKTDWIVSVLSTIIPVRTHQLFIAIVNSLALAIAAYILLFIGEMPNYKLARSIILFFVTFLTYNIYANLIIRQIITNLNIKVET